MTWYMTVYVFSEVFIKAYNDVTELDRSIQKLRSLLNEALDKLHSVRTYLLKYNIMMAM